MVGRTPQPPVYLARKSYRQRRLRDAARMLPIVGAILWVLPILYIAPATSMTGLFIFGIWMFLIFVAATISARIHFGQDEIEGVSGDRHDP